MKITTKDGQDFELEIFGKDGDNNDMAVLKPVKKSEKKEYYLRLGALSERPFRELDYLLPLTPTTALKLSEAISALVEYVQTPISYENPEQHISAGRGMIFDEARKSYQESQDD